MPLMLAANVSVCPLRERYFSVCVCGSLLFPLSTHTLRTPQQWLCRPMDYWARWITLLLLLSLSPQGAIRHLHSAEPTTPTQIETGHCTHLPAPCLQRDRSAHSAVIPKPPIQRYGVDGDDVKKLCFAKNRGQIAC
ncbi:uncharacterized protein TM35_000261900 [Trypanosoma theileri]|uniref:Uncharacterized protein n=1 Tax=Trypanosoma theileri TaxID=67003 RepID=A0A1X0NQF3_9TRYP|nr:uncharacterized protein TM35_000261900 [Trypanosoma theileri]ORC86738.1 hypothetical protein TM35_000261900 [Trypanosoma theileri]